MYHEGDIRPIVKRVRPYRTLLVNLPAKSFGFWVLANTKIEACHDYEDDIPKNELVEAMPLDDETDLETTVKIKRSLLPNLNAKELNLKEVEDDALDKHFFIENKELKRRVKDLNRDLKTIHEKFSKKTVLKRRKRFTSEDHSNIKKKFKYLKRRLEEKWEDRPKFEILRNLFGVNGNENTNMKHRIKKASRFHRSKFDKKNPKNEPPKRVDEVSNEDNSSNDKSRKRRSINREEKNHKHEIKHEREKEDSTENEIDSDLKHAKLWKILHDIQKNIKDIENNDERVNNSRDNDNTDVNEKSNDDGYITVKTKLSGDSATVKYKESQHGVLKSTIDNIISVLGELNNNLNRVWSAVTFLE